MRYSRMQVLVVMPETYHAAAIDAAKQILPGIEVAVTTFYRLHHGFLTRDRLVRQRPNVVVFDVDIPDQKEWMPHNASGLLLGLICKNAGIPYVPVVFWAASPASPLINAFFAELQGEGVHYEAAINLKFIMGCAERLLIDPGNVYQNPR